MVSKPTSATTSAILRSPSGVTPAVFQLDASGFCYERNNSMIFAGVGSGKTLIWLKTIQDWIEEGVIKRAMITGPLRVVRNVWRQEGAKWNSPLSFALCTGEQDPMSRAEAVRAPTDALLVNNTLLPDALEYGGHGCNGLVIDELSKYRNPTGFWNKTLRKAPFDVRSGGTGTPAPNGYTALYGMCHSVGLGHLVGRNYDKWLRRYFYPTDYNQYDWAPLHGALEEIAATIKPYTYIIDEGAVDLPKVMKVPLEVELPADLREKYNEMRATSLLSDEEIVAANAGVARTKLRQIASGFIYDNRGDPVALGNWRLDVLADLVDEMNGQPLIIAYEFKEQRAMMAKRWPNMRFMGGGTSEKYDTETIDLWSRGRCSLLGMHPASAGHGLNDLDLGGSCVAWWQPPDDLELFDQLMGRLTRRGQTAERVRAYMVVASNTIDGAVYDRLGEKSIVEQGLWNALRA